MQLAARHSSSLRSAGARPSGRAIVGAPALRRALVVRAEQLPSQAVTETEAQAAASPATTVPSSAATSVPVAAPAAGGNAGLALGAVAAAVVLFAVTRLGGGGAAPSLATLESMSTPLEVALVNGRPTLVEFYANWCEVCRELVPQEYELEKQYGGKVNFVMLNIENSKWAPEAAEFGVRGIPHFVFFDKTGEPQAAAVGRVPKQIVEDNLQALLKDAPLPYAGAQGRASAAVAPDVMAGPSRSSAMPRDHA
ncbi:hypothetical protein HXX76_015890 [Chlamydomonas incerta]|uniref:Thioredoxin domain-containing protein n=1 Tax=Chlamydomonas incerta TaxID=51695 RepID=A0A835VR09_CHLIN|nr:hypothetical protein HXX76_015890 [Chlamydomonas incerta]|eukprot:KAG2422653.1 hypothetical protein HXX76_015890 [Chlamydomonas incerta]